MHKNNVKSKLKVLDSLLSDTFVSGTSLNVLYSTTYHKSIDTITIQTKINSTFLGELILKTALSFCQLYGLSIYIDKNIIHLFFKNE